ncbi:glycosyltransferase family 1 protein [Geodermatophilus marinus]|nr:glycosyltransferase family 1 protein [Geodermatophilus sp. LHW52908]
MRWARAGAEVTWFTARAPGQAEHEHLDGMHVHRAGGPLSVYPRAAARLLRSQGRFDAVVDCQNGIPFFAPLFLPQAVPVVQVVHHVHQDQFATRFSPAMAAVGRLLEGPVARRVYAQRAIAAVSPSTRFELRHRLGFRNPVFVVPNGTAPVSWAPRDRSPDPLLVVVSRLVPHKRIELLLGALATTTARIPGLRVEIVGDGPERHWLQGLVSDLGLRSTVRLHGYVSAEVRDELLSSAWLTASTSAAEGWGCSVIEAAATGVPCLALKVPGIRDSVLHGETGWLVERPQDLGTALVAAVDLLGEDARAERMAADCRAWARCFSWDRSADLLAGVVVEEMRSTAARSRGRTPERRSARSDMAVLVGFRHTDPADVRTGLRSTDELVQHGDRTSVVLTGCDDFDAAVVLDRIGARDGSLQLADRRLLLAGPEAPPAPAPGVEHLDMEKSA